MWSTWLDIDQIPFSHDYETSKKVGGPYQPTWPNKFSQYRIYYMAYMTFIMWHRYFLPKDNRSFPSGQEIWVIDRGWGQDGWIFAKNLFCVFMDRDGDEVHKRAKAQWIWICSHLDQTSLVNRQKGFIIWKHPLFSCWARRVYPSGKDNALLPDWGANHNAGFVSSCPLTEFAI